MKRPRRRVGRVIRRAARARAGRILAPGQMYFAHRPDFRRALAAAVEDHPELAVRYLARAGTLGGSIALVESIAAPRLARFLADTAALARDFDPRR